MTQWLPYAPLRGTDLSSFALNDRFMKLVPEKDSAAPEAQTGLPLDDPEGPGGPQGEDRTQYGRVTLCCFPTPHPLLLLAPGLGTSPHTQHWVREEAGGDDSPLLNTYYVPSEIPDTSYFSMLTTTINSMMTAPFWG